MLQNDPLHERLPPFHFHADPDLAIQFDADADPDPSFNFDSDPDPASQNDADPDPDPQHFFSTLISIAYFANLYKH